MRRFLLLFTGVVLVGILASIPAVVSGQPAEQVFSTNTPRPDPIVFVTNTQPGPTSTPTNTATATATNTPTPTMTFTPSPTPNGPYIYPDGVNPLTGILYPDEAARQRRNLIIKVSNYPPIVRPQTGVNRADVVYEVEAEGGVTRFAAIFRSDIPDTVGPVRSARLLELELVTMYNSLLAYSGASEPVQNLLLESDGVYQMFSPLKGDGCQDSGFCRVPQEGVDFEHTLYLNPQTLYESATRRNVNYGMRARGFAFSENPDPDGMPIKDVYIEWYGQADARWQYDETTGRYLRFTDGVPHLDAADGQQLWADNLIIIEVPHVERPDLFPPGVDYWSLGIELWGQGNAYLARDGQFYQGGWRRLTTDPGNALELLYPDYTSMMMKPGRTWVSIVRGLSQTRISEELTDTSITTSGSN
jgi:hypothetical protein